MKKLTLAALIALCSAPVLAQQGGFLDPASRRRKRNPLRRAVSPAPARR